MVLCYFEDLSIPWLQVITHLSSCLLLFKSTNTPLGSKVTCSAAAYFFLPQETHAIKRDSDRWQPPFSPPLPQGITQPSVASDDVLLSSYKSCLQRRIRGNSQLRILSSPAPSLSQNQTATNDRKAITLILCKMAEKYHLKASEMKLLLQNYNISKILIRWQANEIRSTEGRVKTAFAYQEDYMFSGICS